MTGESWYYVQDGASIGPLPRVAIDALVHAGTIRPDTLVSPGSGDWVPAASTALASLFAATPGPVPPPLAPTARTSFLPSDPRLLRVVQGVIVLVGLYAVYAGIQQMRLGVKELQGDSSVQLTGCNGVSPEAVQCGFQNMAQQERIMCLDVVITCDGVRHVASTCSDKIPGGAPSTKVVNNFSPAINATMTCTDVSYEHIKIKG